MKIVITSTSNDLDAMLDPRFGRAAYYCLFHEDNGRVEFFENEDKDVRGGAGGKAAEKMVEWKVNRVISGDFGPKAKMLLENFNIQMVAIPDQDKSIKDIIQTLESK